MRRLAILFCVLLFAVSCGPVPYYIDVDVRSEPQYKIDLSDKNIAVIAVNSTNDKDSALVSELGMGIAESIEEERKLEKGSVPVFSVSSENFSIDELGELDLVAIQTSSDLVFTLDSLSLDVYDVLTSVGNNTIVKLPFKFDFGIYDVSALAFDKKYPIRDTIEWNLLSESSISRAKAVATANNILAPAFFDMGKDFVFRFYGQWQTQQRMVVVYSGRDWTRGYEAALNFKWQEAIEYWLKSVYSNSPLKAACAAYNISVACEMQEDYDLALKWLDFAEERYSFGEMKVQREYILKSKERR